MGKLNHDRNITTVTGSLSFGSSQGDDNVDLSKLARPNTNNKSPCWKCGKPTRIDNGLCSDPNCPTNDISIK